MLFDHALADLAPELLEELVAPGNFTSRDFAISMYKHIYVYIERDKAVICNICVCLFAAFLRGFVVSADLRKTCWSFYRGANDSLRDSPQNFRRICAERCQNPGSQSSLGRAQVLRRGLPEGHPPGGAGRHLRK